VRTFIIRLLEDAGGSGRSGAVAPGLRGFVDEVTSGLRARFRNEQELVAALRTAVTVDPPGPPWSGEHRVAPGPSPVHPDHACEEN
jgi:hypothetical protein